MRLRFAVAVMLLLIAGGAHAMGMVPSGCQSSSSEHVSLSSLPLTGKHIVFIGASASDGFQLGDGMCLAHTFDSRLSTDGYRASDFADSHFFTWSEEDREKMVSQAINEKPDIVVAADFLFWYAHPLSTGDKSREAYFEGGLKQLDRFACPIAVGDIPDMRAAAKKTPLIRLVLPSPEFLQKANGRLREWVSQRNLTKPTLLIPLADAVAAQMDEVPLRIGDQEYPTVGLLQPDKLHPTREGQIMLCRLVEQTLIDGKLFCRSDFK